VVDGLDELEARLGDDRALEAGETDSERVFALITRETRRRGGDLAFHAADGRGRQLPPAPRPRSVVAFGRIPARQMAH